MRPLTTTTTTTTTPPSYPPSEDPAAFAATLSAAPSPFLYPEQLGMLPLPESPVPSSSTPHFAAPRHHHRQTASVSSGLHPASPLTQTPLVPPADVPHGLEGKRRAD
ncbi:hypothetical protein JDV02_008283 [Purpureocillium takamizusanense]|uniref:Uncharacterized protein n=1 Tax=Purpureocillium takamizusanense TaxID=2060973 RepID=A0A9Q8QNH2_9HYPO|nr:uncharacterized protein JDV02_008283 [Purpureocillium takamizusanense]UNI22391.1 hypothetical protein JDV02_008283 [Purpureocillium takamizusanense]